MSDDFENMLRQKHAAKVEAEKAAKEAAIRQDKLVAEAKSKKNLNQITATKIQDYFKSLPGDIVVNLIDITEGGEGASYSEERLWGHSLCILFFTSSFGSILRHVSRGKYEGYSGYRDSEGNYPSVDYFTYFALVDGQPAFLHNKEKQWQRDNVYYREHTATLSAFMERIKAHISLNLSEEYRIQVAVAAKSGVYY